MAASGRARHRPRYSLADAGELAGRLVPVASGIRGVDAAVPIGSSRAGRLEAGDAARFTGEGGRVVTAAGAAEVLVWEMR